MHHERAPALPPRPDPQRAPARPGPIHANHAVRRRIRGRHLDAVELLVDSGRWPAGTIGTIVEADADKALIEISDDRGHALDFITVPQDALSVAHDDAEHFAS
jgi:hypothetical protein